MSKELKTQKKHKEKNEMRARILVWWGAFVCFCHLILIQDFTMLQASWNPWPSYFRAPPPAEITDKHNQRQVLNREMDKHVSKIIINLLKSLTFRSQVNYYITCTYVCGGSSRAGTAAPATAEEEIPCQKDASLHKSSRPITAPWRPAMKPQGCGLATCHPFLPVFSSPHEPECYIWGSWAQQVKLPSGGFALRTAHPEISLQQ